MKPILKLNALVLVLLLILSSRLAAGQGTPVQCGTTGGTVPTTYSNWNWEYDLTQPQYCDTWAANIALVGQRFIRAPWSGASSDAIMRIGTTGDYRRTDGWELVRMDFGGNLNSVENPYFVLYNKYSSTLRVFMYLSNRPDYSKVVMTLQHATGNNRSTAVLGLANNLQTAPDKYLARPGQSKDMITYVCKYNGNGWIMGEFTMMFDPYVTDRNFFESALQFDVFGIKSSTLALSGSIQFTTQLDDGYGFSGPAQQIQVPQANGLQSFLGSGAKYLGKVGSWTKEIESLNGDAAKAATSLSAYNTPDKQPLYAAYKLSSFVKQQTESKAANAIKGVLNFAGSLGSAFSLIGTVVGTLWPDAEQSAVVKTAPTISSGTIKLTGTIETSGRLAGFSTQVPGTPHNVPGSPNYNASTFNFSRTYQPYYDCPMGLFNLAATPTFDAMSFPRQTDFPFRSSGLPGDNPPTIVGATSYRPRPLQPVFNQAAGIEVLSVKASIMQKVPFAALNGDFNNSYYYNADYPASRCFNFMRAQVLTGALEVDPYDSGDPALSTPSDDIFLVHTPFVDAACFSQVAFNAYVGDLNSSPAFVRVVATMRRIGAAPTDAPIYFVQDYAPDVVQIRNPANSSQILDQYAINGPTPFGLYQAPRPAYSVNTIDNGVVNVTAVTSSTMFEFNTQYDAPVDLIFTNASRTTLFPPGISASAYLTAGNSIAVEGEMSVLPGNTLVATVSRTELLQCSPLPVVSVAANNCLPNTWALRYAGAPKALAVTQQVVTDAGVDLTPNPTTGVTTAILNGNADEYIRQVEVFNLSGQRLWSSTRELPRRERQIIIPLAGLPTGMYVVRLISNTSSYSRKIQVE